MSEWINVKDQLPNHEQDVITLHKSGRMHILKFADIEKVDQLLKENGILEIINKIQGQISYKHAFCSIERPGMILDNITHWMILPQHPVEQS